MNPRAIRPLLLCIPVACAAAREAPPEFKQPPGWEWLLPPTQFPAGDQLKGTIKEVDYSFDRADKAGMKLTMIVHKAWQRAGIDTEYRGVVFDANGARHVLLYGGNSGDSKKMTINRTLDAAELAPAKVMYAGVEVLTPEGRKILAKDAQKRAKAAGVEVLPLPVIGQPYEFKLTTVDGATVSSAGLRGKVVLIDGWATWCTPCMKKMPKLKTFYDKHKSEGFEIVGLNLDNEAKKFRKAVDEKGLSWPQVHMPEDDAARVLWEESSSINTLPRLILIDRSGIVRAECHPGNLEEEISKLLQSAKTDQP